MKCGKQTLKTNIAFIFQTDRTTCHPSDLNCYFHWAMGSWVPGSIDWLVFDTSAHCSRRVHSIIPPLRFKVWNHSLLSFFETKSCSQSSTCHGFTPLNVAFWHQVFITAAHHCSSHLFELTSVRMGVSWSCCLVHWCETQCIWVPTRDVMGHISLSQASCPFLLLHSAYWRSSPGTGTEALANIKAVSWCGFVKRPGAAEPVASWSKSKEIQQYVCSSVCV